MSLLTQLWRELPDHNHIRRVFWTDDLVEAERIAKLVRELDLKAVRYVLGLKKFEQRPASGTKLATFDVLVSALTEVEPQLDALPEQDES